MTQLFTNNAKALLLNSISATALSFSVKDDKGALFPSITTAGDYFLVTMFTALEGVESNHEILKVTARSGNNFTCLRGQEGTEARVWPADTAVELRITAATVSGLDNQSVTTKQVSATSATIGTLDLGTPLPVAEGGTGGATAATARTNLDVYSKSEADARFINVEGTVTLTGDVTGTATFSGDNVAISTTIAANSVALGTDTTGDYVATVAQGSGITVTGTTGEGAARTVAHADTSNQANVTNTGGTFLQSAAFDEFGHVTSVTSAAVPAPSQVVPSAADTQVADTFPLLVDAQTGTQTLKTDAGLKYNPSTDTLTVANVAGNASTASRWQTARTVTLAGDLTGSASLDGSANVTLTATVAANSVALGTDTTGDYIATGAVSGNGLTGSATGEGSTFTVTSNATAANTASTLVFRDASGNFSAGTITASLNGNASTATSATNATNLAVTDDTTTNATYYPSFSLGTTGNQAHRVASTKLTFNPSTGALGATTFSGGHSGDGSALTNLNAGNIATGTLTIARGGTNGSATPTAGAVAYGTGTAYAFTAAGTAGQVLTSNGSGAPTWQAVAAGTSVSVTDTDAATTLYPLLTSTTSGTLSSANVDATTTPLTYNPNTGTLSSSAFSGAFTGSGANLTNLNASNLATGTVPDARFPATLPALSGANLTDLNAGNIATGTLTIARGGTNGSATPTAGAVAYGTGTAYAFTAAGTAGQVLTSNGTGAPTWQNAAAGGSLTVTNDNTATTFYPLFTTTTSGSLTAASVDATTTPLSYVPSTSTLTASTFSGSLSGNATTATTLQTSRTISLSGDVTGSASFNGGANAAISATLANSGVTAGSFGSSTQVPVLSIDAKGRVTSASTATVSAGAVTVTTTANNVSYPFVLSTNQTTGSQNLLMDSSGGTYNPSTNTAAISISGNAATATAASGSAFSTQQTAGEGQLVVRTSGQNDAYLFNNSTEWGCFSNSGGRAFSYSRATATFTFFGNANNGITNRSNALNGYAQFGTGMVIQWGRTTLNQDSTANITFPIAFPSSVVYISWMQDAALNSTGQGTMTVGNVTTTGAQLRNGNDASSTTTFWVAIGY